MDLYSKTTLANTRHHELLAEADAARLAAAARTGGRLTIVRAAGVRLAEIVSGARAARVVRTSSHEARARS